MANKMTIDELKSFVKTYVLANKEAVAFADVKGYANMIEKIGDQVTIDGSFSNPLSILIGDDLPYGTTIEEYFQSLPMARDYADGVSQDDLWDEYSLSFEDCAYSFSQARKKIAYTTPLGAVKEAVSLGAEAVAELTGSETKKFNDAYTNVKYTECEQAIGNAFSKAIATQKEVLAVPTDTETGEAFILKVKKLAEVAKARNTGNNLANSLIGGCDKLILVVKQGVMPDVEVNTLAGAIHDNYLGLPVETITVDSFGSADDSKLWCALLDPRGIKVRNHYNSVNTETNANKDKLLVVRHYQDTTFVSKYTYMHYFTEA